MRTFSKKFWIIVLCVAFVVAMLTGGLILFFSCNNEKADFYRLFARERDGVTEFGIEGVQKAVITPNGEDYTFEMYADIDGDYAHVIAGDVLESSLIDGKIHSVEIIKSNEEEFEVAAEGENFSVKFSGNKNSPFIGREFSLKFSNAEEYTVPNQIQDGDVKFYLNSLESEFLGEKGFIGTYSMKYDLVNVYGSLPAIYSHVFNDNVNISVISVMDWNNTAPMFKKARRYYNNNTEMAQIGFLSNKYDVSPESEYKFCDYVMIADGEKYDSFAQLQEVRAQLGRIQPIDFESMWESDNRVIDDLGTLVNGMLKEISDARTSNDSLAGAFNPYAYAGGWSESFTALSILRGWIKYAGAIGDEELYETALERALVFADTTSAHVWIEDLNGFGDYLHMTFSGGKFIDNDGDHVTGATKGIGTYYYFDRVNALGEIALYTKNEELIDAFQRLLPLIRNYMVMEDYKQPIYYRLDTLEPLIGTEGGGSSSAAAMWAHINLLAYQLADANDPDKDTYLEDAIGSVKWAASLDLESAKGIQDAPRSTSVSWIVRTLTSVYEITGDESLLPEIQRAINGLFHFYYYGTNPYSTFINSGFSVACSEERQEAAFEICKNLWLCAPALKYVDDPKVFELYASAYYSIPWLFPINLDSIGTHHPNPNTYEFDEAKYVPYEFPTGVLNDPSFVDADQRFTRMTKEIYGAGDPFGVYLIFEAFGYSTNKAVNIICSNAATATPATDYYYTLYNTFTTDQDTVVRFDNLKTGTYKVVADDKELGSFGSEQLKNGLKFSLNAKQLMRLSVAKVSDSESAIGQFNTELTIQAETTHNSAVITAVSSQEAAILYILQASSTNSFNAENTTVSYSMTGVFKETFHDSERRYYRVAAVNASGECSAWKEIDAKGKNVTVLAQDDMGKEIETNDVWRVHNTDLRSNGSQGIMNILAWDIGYGKSWIERDFIVNADGDCTLEFSPYAINSGAEWSLIVTMNGKEHVLVDKSGRIGNDDYLFDLKGLDSTLQGDVTVTVRIELNGINRGFVFSGVRFLRYNDAAVNYVDILGEQPEGGLAYEFKDGVANVSINETGDQFKKEINTSEIDFANTPYMQLTLSGVRILDQVKVRVFLEKTNELVCESTEMIGNGLTIRLDMSEFAGAGPQKYKVIIENVSGAESASIEKAVVSASSDFTQADNIIAAMYETENSVIFSVEADFDQTPYLVFENSGMEYFSTDLVWRLYVYDEAADELVEMRILEEIEGYPEDPSYEGANNGWYFRSKQGQFVYDARALMGGGKKQYKIILSLEGKGSMDVVRFYLKNTNELTGNGR